MQGHNLLNHYRPTYKGADRTGLEISLTSLAQLQPVWDFNVLRCTRSSVGEGIESLPEAEWWWSTAVSSWQCQKARGHCQDYQAQGFLASTPQVLCSLSGGQSFPQVVAIQSAITNLVHIQVTSAIQSSEAVNQGWPRQISALRMSHSFVHDTRWVNKIIVICFDSCQWHSISWVFCVLRTWPTWQCTICVVCFHDSMVRHQQDAASLWRQLYNSVRGHSMVLPLTLLTL